MPCCIKAGSVAGPSRIAYSKVNNYSCPLSLNYPEKQAKHSLIYALLLALQENDHMTKVEMFLCAACNVFLTSSASSVQAHITSQDHLSNIKVTRPIRGLISVFNTGPIKERSRDWMAVLLKEFGVRQRRNCLDKAEAMMKELQPQFEHFLKVFCNKLRSHLVIISWLFIKLIVSLHLN